MDGDVDHLGHVHLKVRDLDRSIEFYTAIIDGLEVSERVGQFVFLTLGTRHHDLALQEVDERSPAPETDSDAVGLYHAAWEVGSMAALNRTHERLRDRAVSVTPVDHGISLALYFDDPDGNGNEVYHDVRTDRDRSKWAGQNEPFDPTAL